MDHDGVYFFFFQQFEGLPRARLFPKERGICLLGEGVSQCLQQTELTGAAGGQNELIRAGPIYAIIFLLGESERCAKKQGQQE